MALVFTQKKKSVVGESSVEPCWEPVMSLSMHMQVRKLEVMGGENVSFP